MIRYLDSHFVSVRDPVKLRELLLPGLLRAYGSRLSAVFLHGSRAGGRHRADSDLDIMIIVSRSALGKAERLRTVPVPEDYQGPPMSPLVLTVAEFRRFPPIVLSLLDGHVVWYSAPGDTGAVPSAQQLIGELERWVREQKIERVRFRGGHYWRRVSG